MKDEAYVRTTFPPDLRGDGLYINQQKVELRPGFQVYFVSDRTNCVRVELSKEEGRHLKDEVRQWDDNQLKQYIHEKILPRFEKKET